MKLVRKGDKKLPIARTQESVWTRLKKTMDISWGFTKMRALSLSLSLSISLSLYLSLSLYHIYIYIYESLSLYIYIYIYA